MSDLNWCTSCDNAISPFSESLYCSEQCLRADALRNHPLLGYTYPEFTDFPRAKPVNNTPSTSSPITLVRQSTQSSSSSSIRQSSPKLSYSYYSSANTSPALTATSTQSDTSSQFSSPPKFDLLSNSTTTKDKMNNCNYFSIFNTNHIQAVTTSDI